MAADDADAAIERLKQSAGSAAQQSSHGELHDSATQILERLDALEARIEGGEEINRLSREVRKYISDKREELANLRWWRSAAILSAAAFAGAVIVNFIVESSRGFPSIVEISERGGVPVAAFIGVSFGAVLALLLVVLRGIFQSIDKAEGDSYLPPQISELYEALKRFRD